MFSLKDPPVRRRIYICAFTTHRQINGESLHLKTVRADSSAEATGLVMAWAWSSGSTTDFYRMVEWVGGPVPLSEDVYYGDPGIVEDKIRG